MNIDRTLWCVVSFVHAKAIECGTSNYSIFWKPIREINSENYKRMVAKKLNNKVKINSETKDNSVEKRRGSQNSLLTNQDK